MGINHLGHFLLTQLLLPQLRASVSARVVTVASTGMMQANLNIPDFFCETGWRGFGYTMHYGNSKLANCLFSKELAKREATLGTGIKSYALCPGFVKDTNILRNYEGRALAETFMAGIGVSLEKVRCK
jgi:NAD(P)-dependent dehydrogenase (short-subunit alcohol dehydrogenase family)